MYMYNYVDVVVEQLACLPVTQKIGGSFLPGERKQHQERLL